MEQNSNPGYTNPRFPPQSNVQQFRGAGMVDNSHQGFGTESPNVTSPTFPRQPTPELQWDPTMFVDFVANKWKLQPADRK